MAPRVPPDGMIRFRLLLLQAHACVYQLPSASIYATDRKDGYTPQAFGKILAQHPLARDSTITLHGRLHVHGPLARGSTTRTRPRKAVASPTRPPTQPLERAYGSPHRWETISASRLTSTRASFEPPSTNCKPSPKML
jgi:hypothetical protein